MSNQGSLQQYRTEFLSTAGMPEWQPSVLLLAEDEMVSRQHGAVFSKLTIDHHCATNSGDALRIVAKQPKIALVVIDTERTDDHCLRLLDALRQGLAARSWTQYLLVTANVEARQCIRAMRLGAGDILLRPSEMRQLPQAILSALSRSHRAYEQQFALAIGRAALTAAERERDFEGNGAGNRLGVDFDIGNGRGNGASMRLDGRGTPPYASNDHYQSIIDVLLRLREVRQEILPSQASDEVSWTILLDVYQSMKQEEHAASLSSLMISRTSASTALRRVHDMIESGLLERSPDPDDRRRYFTHLTKKGWDAVEQYLAFAEHLLDAYRHPC